MLIKIQYHNNKYDYVKPWMLDKLLESDKIQSFYRSSGWAHVGKDKIRGIGGFYNGTERRQTGKYI